MRENRGQAAYPLLGNEIVPEGKTDLCLNGPNGVKLPSKQLVARSNRARDASSLKSAPPFAFETRPARCGLLSIDLIMVYRTNRVARTQLIAGCPAVSAEIFL